MGVQEHKTKVIQATLNPRWNASMQFTIKDLEQDVLCITVFDRDLFSPNGKRGFADVQPLNSHLMYLLNSITVRLAYSLKQSVMYEQF